MTNVTSETGITKSSSWTPEQLKLIQDTVAKGTTADEFKLFIYTAHKYGFDPLIKQIWCVKYGTAPAAIFTGRDGFLHKAHESGQFNGLKTEREFNGTEIVSATCKVFRKDMEHPVEVTVYRSEYDTKKSNWLKMPITMLCKVAESQALRKAFDISGIYSEDESAVIERTVDATATEMLSDELQMQILACTNEDELKNLWTSNKHLHGKAFFKSAITKRKDELSSPKSEEVKSKEPAPLSIPDEIYAEIATAETLQNLNAIYAEYTAYHESQEFISLINKRKIAIAKPTLKKQTA